MKHQHHETVRLDAAIAAGPSRFRRLPERIRPQDTFISVPATAATQGQDGYDPDQWLVRMVWCGSLL